MELKFKAGSIFIFIIFLLFTSCQNSSDLIQKHAPEKENKFAKSILELLINDQPDSVYNLLELSLRTNEAIKSLEKVKLYLTQAKLKKIELIEYYTTSSKVLLSSDSSRTDKKETILKYELEYEEKWILAEIVISEINGKMSLHKLNVRSFNEPIKELYNLSIYSGTGVNWIFLLIAIMELGIIFYTLVKIFKQNPKRKWLWIFFTIIGFFKFNTYWGQSVITMSSIVFQFFGVSFYKHSLLEPYVLSISIPIGAISYLIKNRRRTREDIKLANN